MRLVPEAGDAPSGGAGGGWSAQRIRELRHSFGLAQEDMAVKIGVRLSTLNRWERGKQKPTRVFVAKLDQLAREVA